MVQKRDFASTYEGVFVPLAQVSNIYQDSMVMSVLAFGLLSVDLWIYWRSRKGSVQNLLGSPA